MKMPLNALKLIYCKFHIAQIIDIEIIDNIIKGALEVFFSVYMLNSIVINYTDVRIPLLTSSEFCFFPFIT